MSAGLDFETKIFVKHDAAALKVLRRLREMHSGKLYHSEFGHRMHGSGHHADQIETIFNVYCKRYGLTKPVKFSVEHFDRGVGKGQLGLF